MRDTRTYDDLGAALRAMPYESRELTLTLMQITMFEFAAPSLLVFGGDAGELADRVLERLAEHFDNLTERAELTHPIEAAESLRDVILSSSLDWGSARDVAWVYGIVVGWDSQDDDDIDAMSELAERFNWPPETVDRLRHLHSAFSGGTR